MRARTAAFSAVPTGCGRSGPSTRASAASARSAENCLASAVPRNGDRGWFAQAHKNHTASATTASAIMRTNAIGSAPHSIQHNALSPLGGEGEIFIQSRRISQMRIRGGDTVHVRVVSRLHDTEDSPMRLSAPFPVLFFASAAHGLNHVLLTLYLTLVLVITQAWHL